MEATFTSQGKARPSVFSNTALHSVALQDCLFLSLIVLLSLILYVQRLGFYSDDWAFLGMFSNSQDQSIFGLFQSLYKESNARTRPGLVLYLSGLYWLFGLHPLGYHVVNAVVFNALILLFYLTLRRLGQPRLLTLAVPLVYALLPNYSTDRFWYAAFQANLSMALYFLSSYSDLRALEARSARLWGWQLLSIFCLLASILSYEITVPLFAFNIFFIGYLIYRSRALASSGPKARTILLAFQAAKLLTLAVVVLFKWLTTTHGIAQPGGMLTQIIKVVRGAIHINYVSYGPGLLRALWRIFYYYPDREMFALAGLLALAIFCYLYYTISKSGNEWPSITFWLKVIVSGLFFVGLGYAIYVSTRDFMLAKTGILNRVSIAAAVGVAVSLVGGFGLVSTLLRSDLLRKIVFSLSVALICTSGFLCINTLASMWAGAYRQEQEVLADIQSRFPTLPAGSTLLLDGVCPYVGPAIVFESSWDLEGALRTSYRNPTLKANVISPRIKIEEDGLSTHLYSESFRYPYGEKLLLYNFDQKKI